MNLEIGDSVYNKLLPNLCFLIIDVYTFGYNWRDYKTFCPYTNTFQEYSKSWFIERLEKENTEWVLQKNK